MNTNVPMNSSELMKRISDLRSYDRNTRKGKLLVTGLLILYMVWRIF